MDAKAYMPRPATLETFRFTITTALLCTGLGTGIYNLKNPLEGTALFGVRSSSSTKAVAGPQAALARIYAVRNISSGISGFGLLLYLGVLQRKPASGAAIQALRHAIGISFLAGTFVAAGDALVLAKLAEDRHIYQEDAEHARRKSYEHAVTSLLVAGLGLAWILF